MAISWGLPKLVSKILEAVPAINYLLNALAKMDYTGTENIPTGAIRLESENGGYQLQRYNGTSWVSVGKLIHDADSVDGKSASTSATANTIPVRDSSGKIAGDITGNAATASSAAALSTTLAIGKGGTGATSASAARSNLGAPPTSHASSGTTYGLASATVYGHAMATSDAPEQDTDSGSLGTDVTHFARADHAHKKVLGTSSVYGQVKLTDSVSSTSAASSHIGASAKAVKTAYDKAVAAAGAAVLMTGATSSAEGKAGLVPAPAKGEQRKPLRGDSTWADSLDCDITGNAATATKLQGGTGNLAMPIGAIYVQFPTQQEPNVLFGGTWSNISYLYDGCFFRAEGNKAAAFGNGVQGWAAPQIFGELYDVHFGTQPSSTGGLTYFWQGTYPGGSTSGSTQYIYGNVQLNANAYNTGYGAADEVRPVNHTIRIWKRTA